MTDLVTYVTRHAARIALFVALGVAIAFDGLRKRHPGEDIQTWQWAKTVVIGLVAGLLASTQATNPSGTVVSLFLAVATKIVNSAWDTYLPPKLGGSNTHGIGAELDIDLRGTNPLVDEFVGMVEDVLDRKLDEHGLTRSTAEATAAESETSSRPEERDHPDAPEPSADTEPTSGDE